jgi:hypothetical protein
MTDELEGIPITSKEAGRPDNGYLIQLGSVRDIRMQDVRSTPWGHEMLCARMRIKLQLAHRTEQGILGRPLAGCRCEGFQGRIDCGRT